MSTSVLLIDDHELIRQGLARAFERDEAMTVEALDELSEAYEKYLKVATEEVDSEERTALLA